MYAEWDAKAAGRRMQADWEAKLDVYGKTHSQEAGELVRRMKGELPENFGAIVRNYLATCTEKQETIATRKASQNAIQALAPVLPEFLGGSADLTGSNLTNWKECIPLRVDHFGNHISYGVREFGMSAIMNGVALHGGYIPFGATFLTFSDYSRKRPSAWRR